MGDLAGTYLIKGMYRNRGLLDLAHDLQICANCGRHSPEGLEPAHSNLEAHGKGFRLKAHDCFFAALCNACHAWYDNAGGSGLDPTGIWKSTWEDKREMLLRAMHKTMLELWRLGKLRVA